MSTLQAKLIQRLGPTDAPAVERLLELVRDDPRTRPFLSPAPRPLLMVCLEGAEGCALGTCVEHEVIACRLVRLASTLAEYADRAAYSEWPVDGPDLARSAHFCGVAVHPAHRRRGLALGLTKAALEWATRTQRRHAVTTCHPDNHGGLSMLEEAGFRVIGRTISSASDQARFFLAASLSAATSEVKGGSGVERDR